MNNTISGLPRLSGDFNKGYTRAIQDITEIFKYVSRDLKYNNKRLNNKLIVELLDCILENRAELRDQMFVDEKHQGFIRYNVPTNKFEYYKPKE